MFKLAFTSLNIFLVNFIWTLFVKLSFDVYNTPYFETINLAPSLF